MISPLWKLISSASDAAKEKRATASIPDRKSAAEEPRQQFHFMNGEILQLSRGQHGVMT